MDFDFTVTFSVLLALSTVLANVVSTLLNNKHQIKIKKLEMYELQKREVLQNFINSTIECYKNNNDWRQNKEFMKYLFTMQLYFKSANSEFIQTLNSLMDDVLDKSDFNIQFAKIISKLSKEIQKS